MTKLNHYGKFRKDDKPDPDKVLLLAASGLTRAEIAKGLNMDYKRFCRHISNSESLTKAFRKGVQKFQDKHHAKK